MADRWVDTPPVPCHITGRVEAKPGQPYLVEEYLHSPAVAAPDGKNLMPAPRLRPLVHAASQIRRVCELPGSPFVLLTHDEHQALLDFREGYEAAERRIEALEAQLDEARALQGAVDQVLSNGLLERLDARYAKRPGPKPRAA